jgi:hypothetical protein
VFALEDQRRTDLDDIALRNSAVPHNNAVLRASAVPAGIEELWGHSSAGSSMPCMETLLNHSPALPVSQGNF